MCVKGANNCKAKSTRTQHTQGARAEHWGKMLGHADETITEFMKQIPNDRYVEKINEVGVIPTDDPMSWSYHVSDVINAITLFHWENGGSNELEIVPLINSATSIGRGKIVLEFGRDFYSPLNEIRWMMEPVAAWRHAKSENAVPEWFVVTSMVDGKMQHVGMQRRKAAVVVARCASSDRIMSWAFDSWLSLCGQTAEYPAGEMQEVWTLVKQKVDRLFKEKWEKRAEKFTIDYADQCALELGDYATKLLQKKTNKTPLLHIKAVLIKKHKERTKDSVEYAKLEACAEYATKIFNIMSRETMDALEYRLKGIEQRTVGVVECTHKKVYNACNKILHMIAVMVSEGMLEVMNAKMNGCVEDAISSLLESRL